jgi:hypothetical protein
MKQFIRNSLLLFCPFVFWSGIVLAMDPFNYWGFTYFVSEEVKRENALPANELLYRSLEYLNRPGENVIIGDSRVRMISRERIKELSGISFGMLSAGSLKINEMIELSYMANTRLPLKRLVIGINFNLFSEFSYANRVDGLKELLDNPLFYIFNKNTAAVCYHEMRSVLTGFNLSDARPAEVRADYWSWFLKWKPSQWYGRYRYPVQLHEQIVTLDQFAKDNGIELTFIIVPHHKELRDRIATFEIEDELVRFHLLLASLHARVVNFDRDSVLTTDRENFGDPIHFSADVGRLIVDEVWGGALKYGEEL